MTQDVVALTPQMPDTKTLLAGSVAGRLIAVHGGEVWPREAGHTDLVTDLADTAADTVPLGVDLLTENAARTGRKLQIVTPPGTRNKGSTAPAVYMAMTHATELQNRGFSRIGFELGDESAPWGIDVFTRNADGSMDYGYQLKDVKTINAIGKAARKSAGQLIYPMTQRVAILDVHQPLGSLTTKAFREIERAAKDAEATYLVRFEDGAITVPPDGPLFP
ncbi:hypothetical protein ACFV8E_05140 [Streptomyces sp. NPDC059849]|uniref:hypothetical protein n=1 Tax=unclassified Streptomyces TaxID=2593676 RepID=UPI00365F5799